VLGVFGGWGIISVELGLSGRGVVEHAVKRNSEVNVVIIYFIINPFIGIVID